MSDVSDDRSVLLEAFFADLATVRRAHPDWCWSVHPVGFIRAQLPGEADPEQCVCPLTAVARHLGFGRYSVDNYHRAGYVLALSEDETELIAGASDLVDPHALRTAIRARLIELLELAEKGDTPAWQDASVTSSSVPASASDPASASAGSAAFPRV